MTALELVDEDFDGHGCVVVAGSGAEQRLTVKGRSDGIVSDEPFQQQCRACGRIAGPRLLRAGHFAGPGLSILLGGFRFHVCERPGGVRRCPECHAEVIAACTLRRHDE